MPSNGGFVGEMGQLLDHGLLEAEEHDGGRDEDVADIGPERTRAHTEHPPLDITIPGCATGPSSEVRGVIRLRALTPRELIGPFFSMLQSECDSCTQQPWSTGQKSSNLCSA